MVESFTDGNESNVPFPLVLDVFTCGETVFKRVVYPVTVTHMA